MRSANGNRITLCSIRAPDAHASYRNKNSRRARSLFYFIYIFPSVSSAARYLRFSISGCCLRACVSTRDNELSAFYIHVTAKRAAKCSRGRAFAIWFRRDVLLHPRWKWVATDQLRPRGKNWWTHFDWEEVARVNCTCNWNTFFTVRIGWSRQEYKTNICVQNSTDTSLHSL